MLEWKCPLKFTGFMLQRQDSMSMAYMEFFSWMYGGMILL